MDFPLLSSPPSTPPRPAGFNRGHSGTRVLFPFQGLPTPPQPRHLLYFPPLTIPLTASEWTRDTLGRPRRTVRQPNRPSIPSERSLVPGPGPCSFTDSLSGSGVIAHSRTNYRALLGTFSIRGARVHLYPHPFLPCVYCSRRRRVASCSLTCTLYQSRFLTRSP